MTDHVDYTSTVSHTLGGFQILEDSLKTYIEIYHDAVRRHLPKHLYYAYARRDVQGAALGKLINVFAKINGNNVLIDELRSLIKTRDELAHTGLLAIYGRDDIGSELDHKIVEYYGVAERVNALLKQVLKETLLVSGGSQQADA